MFAVINRVWTGVFVWTTIGLSIGYAMGVMGDRRGLDLLLPMAAGLIGSLVVGVGLGEWLTGYDLWVCNAGAAIGGFLFAAAVQWLSRIPHGEADGPR